MDPSDNILGDAIDQDEDEEEEVDGDEEEGSNEEEEEEEDDEEEEEQEEETSEEEEEEEKIESCEDSSSNEEEEEEEACYSAEESCEDAGSIIEPDELERRYVLATESFLHLKDPGLEDAFEDLEKKREKCHRGIKKDINAYKKLCDELGVSPNAAFLSQLQNEVMDLSYQGINQKGMHAIFKILENNPYVVTLIVRGNDCGGEAGDALGEMLKFNNTITHLNLSATGIAKSMKKICEGAAYNNPEAEDGPICVLEVLDISINDLTSKEMRPLAKLLKQNILKELYMGRNFIEDDGLIPLANAINKNSQLQILDLSSNRLWGEQGAAGFFNQLRLVKTLTHLELQGNSIKNPSGSAIAALMVTKKGNLEHLNISFNLLEHQTCANFGASFGNSNTMKTFIAGPNSWNMGPLTTKHLTKMIQPLVRCWNPVAEELDMSIISPYHKEFREVKQKVEKTKPNLKLIHGEEYGLTEPKRPDMQELIIRKAFKVCASFETPLSCLIDELRAEPPTMNQKQFKKFIKMVKLYKDKKMTKEFIKNFPVKDKFNEVDCKAIIAVFDRVYPKRTLSRNQQGQGEKEGEGEA